MPRNYRMCAAVMNIVPYSFRHARKLAMLLLVCSVSCGITRSQTDDIPRRAANQYEKAMEQLRLRTGDYEKAEKHLHKAIKRYENYPEAHLALGQVYFDTRRYDKACASFERVMELDENHDKELYYLAGWAAFRQHDYATCIRYYEQYLDQGHVVVSKENRVAWHLENARFRMKARANPVPFEPENMCDSVNSPFAEYFPTLTADEQILIFTRRLERAEGEYNPDRPSTMYNEDFYLCVWDDEGEVWREARNMARPINTRLNEGAQTVSPDGRYLFFTGCNRPDSHGSCDIYYSRREGSYWSEPVNIGPPVNTHAWESQPSISSDGKQLYFTSNRKGGYGKMDLWVSKLQPNGKWGKPKNLGSNVNTKEDEQSPFIHPDNKTLYFSSDQWSKGRTLQGHVGMGREDIYVSRKDSTGAWGAPANLGFPINTEGTETGIFINARGDKAYFASDRFEGGKGQLDIYTFDLYEEVRPTPVSYVKGAVFDVHNKKPLHAHIELIELASGETVIETSADRVNGTFLVCLPAGKDYGLNVSRSGYLFYSDHFALGDHEVTEPFLMDVPLERIEIGGRVVLKNIFFDTDAYTLKKASKAELDRLVRFLRKNRQVEVEIAGHTDNVGKPAYNQQLSENRAKAVYDYLSKQLDKERLSYKGYGETEPVATNDTPEGRAQNRRTEFVIISE